MHVASHAHPVSARKNRRLEIHPRSPRIVDGFVRFECAIRRVDEAGSDERILWYEIPEGLPRIDSDDAEPFLIALLMDAMMEGRDLHVGGRVGFQLLSNLHEFMSAWSRWFPDAYRVVEVSADWVDLEPASTGLPHDGAVLLHTGALDATCTLYRHLHGMEGFRSRQISACVMIQGHLLSLDQKEKFARGLALAREALAGQGISVHPLRTNFREVIRTRWNDVYGVAAISALQFLKPLARSCLISGAKAYDDRNAFPTGPDPIRVPGGSNPLTNALLSSDSMKVLHDGARYDFVEKVEIVSRWPEGTRCLRVCWRGSQLEPHCGVCEECVRTKLAYLALGKVPPESLGAPPTMRVLLGLLPMGSDCRSELRQVLQCARKNGIAEPWVRELSICLRLEPHLKRFLHLKWIFRRVFDKVRGR